MRKLFTLFLATFVCWHLFGQIQPPALSFAASINGVPIQMNSWMALSSGKDSVYITKLKFYVTEIRLIDNGKNIQKSNAEVLLIDFDAALPSLPSVSTAFDQISFNLGIDSATQSAGALDGELDPLKGMYWTWQSGYIHFKLEGMIRQADGNEQKITLHLGGYRSPNNSIQKISLLSSESLSAVTLELDLIDLIENVLSSHRFHIMSPGKDAVEFSEIISHAFKFKSR